MHASSSEEHEALDLEPGTTRVLTESGCEEVDYGPERPEPD